MNIAFISYWSCPLTPLGVLTAGGMNVYELNLANSLVRLGCRVDIFTRTHKQKDGITISVHKDVRVIHLPFFNSDDHYLAVQSYANRLLEFMVKNSLSYQIIHAHYFFSGLVGIKLKENLHISMVQTFHTLGILKKQFGKVTDEKRIRAEKEIIGKADGIIASTALEVNDLVKHYRAKKDKIFEISPGVDHRVFKALNQKTSRVRLHLPLNKKIILFVGRIDPIKGINLLIEAVSILSKRYPSFENNFLVLLIGGDINSRKFWLEEEVRKISRLILDKKLECCVKFIGSRPNYLLPYYYSASNVMVMPSVYESFGLVVLEAMACGSAIVASKVGGLVYLIKDKLNGRLFKSNNVKSLSTVLWELLIDNKQREDLARMAEKSSQSYCWDKQALKMIKVYNKLT